MFEIKNVFVQDNKLGDVLRALAGKVIEPPIPVPVKNATMKKGKVVQANETITGRELVRRCLRGVDAFKTNTINKVLAGAGFESKGSGGMLHHFLKQGLIKHGQHKGEWIVTAKGKEEFNG
jgi:hypothetical protein